MKALRLALTLMACLVARVAQAEPAGAEAVEPPDHPAPETSTPTNTTPLEQAEARTDPTASPRGELVRLSKLPEAELMVDVELKSNDPLAYFEVTSEKSGASLLICDSACRFRIWPGRYRLITNASEGYVGGSNLFVVDRSSNVQIEEPRISRPILGAIIGTVGTASALAGALFIAVNDCTSNCSTRTTLGHQVGIASLGAGLVFSLAGWTLYAQSRSPNVTVQPSQTGSSE